MEIRKAGERLKSPGGSDPKEEDDDDGEERSVGEYLSSLCYFIAGRDPGRWRSIWNEWKYSEVVEFAVMKSEDQGKISDELEELKCESAEGYMVSLMMKILSRMN